MASKIIDQKKVNVALFCFALVLLSSVVGTLIMTNFQPSQKEITVMAENEATLVEKILARDGEIRAVWIATVANINFPSRPDLSKAELEGELDSILSTLLENSMNTVILQVRPSCDALYTSSLFPASEFLVGEQGGDLSFDVLEYLTEEAHKLGIAVCAWVNPLRVSTQMNQSKGEADLLCESNPARIHPEYTVKYGNDLFFDPGIAEVRTLVAEGVYEIASNYPVDAIVFDDYFYPYPKDSLTFDDSKSYLESQSSLPLEDWRRENVNLLVEESYNGVKRGNANCYFGISPFGIWCNDNGTNGGSATTGLSAYNAIYCDAKSWIEGGYIDFISPQLYWSFENTSAPYQTLCDWWDKALVDFDLPLIVSHGAYRSEEWGDGAEIARQVEYARTKECYLGSAMYGYSALFSDSCGVASCLREIYN